MFNAIQSWYTKNSLRKKLLSFLNEMEKNLETFYVMDQRQFIVGGYTMDVWDQVKDMDIIKNQAAVQTYVTALTDFNNAYKEYKEYEQWYSSDTQNKTNDNAKKLHALKNGLDQRIKPLEPVIILAGQSFEKELLNLGLIAS